MSLIQLHFGKIVLLDIRFSVDGFVFDQFEYGTHCHLEGWLFRMGSCLSSRVSLLCDWSSSLLTFKIFYVFLFQHLCLDLDLMGFILFGAHEAPWTCKLSQIWGVLAIVSSTVLSALSSVLSGSPLIHVCCCTWSTWRWPKICWACLFFSILKNSLSLCSSDWMISHQVWWLFCKSKVPADPL